MKEYLVTLRVEVLVEAKNEKEARSNAERELSMVEYNNYSVLSVEELEE